MKITPILFFAALAGPLSAQTVQWNTDTLDAFDVTVTGSFTPNGDPTVAIGQTNVQDPLGYEGLIISGFTLDSVGPGTWLLNVSQSIVQFETPGYTEIGGGPEIHLQTDGGFGDAFDGESHTTDNELGGEDAPGWRGAVQYSLSEVGPTTWDYTITVDEVFTPAAGFPVPGQVPDGYSTIWLLALGLISLSCQRRSQSSLVKIVTGDANAL